MNGVLVKHKKQHKVVSKRTLWTQTEEETKSNSHFYSRHITQKKVFLEKELLQNAKTAMHIRRSLKNIKHFLN